jgi:FkbM family methyltransferase
VSDRHVLARAVARSAYRVPGARTGVRQLLRFTGQRLEMRPINQQRLINFFAPDVLPEGGVAGAVRVPGGRPLRVSFDFRDELSVRWYLFGYRGYEPHVTRLMRGLLLSHTCVIDVGANLGYYALLAAAMLDGRGRVHAFEPEPAVFSGLCRNAELSGLQNLRIAQAAVSDKDGHATLFLPATPGDRMSSSLLPDMTEHGGEVRCRTVRLDTYCASSGIDRVDLLRIDAEGAEAKVLTGMGALLDRWSPDIVCEVLCPSDELTVLLSSLEYQTYAVTDRRLQAVDVPGSYPGVRDYYFTRGPIGPEILHAAGRPT